MKPAALFFVYEFRSLQSDNNNNNLSIIIRPSLKLSVNYNEETFIQNYFWTPTDLKPPFEGIQLAQINIKQQVFKEQCAILIHLNALFLHFQ
jgi:hypothetical protein